MPQRLACRRADLGRLSGGNLHGALVLEDNVDFERSVEPRLAGGEPRCLRRMREDSRGERRLESVSVCGATR